jgi:hypothetical protein
MTHELRTVMTTHQNLGQQLKLDLESKFDVLSEAMEEDGEAESVVLRQ